MSEGTQSGRNGTEGEATDRRAVRVQARTAAVVRSLGRVIFGDRLGLTVFLGALLWCGALWRVGIFIQDSVTVANALANVAEGRLAIVNSPYALSLGEQPGLVEVDGQAFGRNYGHVLLALPLLALLELGAVLVAPKLLLAGAWSFGLIAFAVHVGRLTGRKRIVTGGSAVALAVFAGNVATATTLPASALALVALQLSTIVAAGFIAVVLYRLVEQFHGDRVGTVAGVAAIVATPVGFWATIPKRHVVTALAAVVALYCFAASRERTDHRGTLARAGSYAALGLLTTVHPFEAFFLFVVLVPIDLVTAPKNSPRTILSISLLFVLSMLPFFVINTLISGSPIESPRLLSGYGSGIDTSLTPDSGGGGGGEQPSDSGGQTPGGDNTNGSASSGGGESGQDGSADGGGSPSRNPISFITPFVAFAGSVVGFVGDWVGGSFDVLRQFDRLGHIFVRSGQIPGISTRLNGYEAIELTLLESFPLAAALVWLPVAAVRAARTRAVKAGITEPRRQTDLLAAAFAVVFAIVYLPRLPLFSQITVRYILPVMPLLVYGVARCSVVRRALEDSPRWVAGSYAVTVVVGGTVMTAVLALLQPAIGEAMQFHALVGLGTAVVTAVALATWPGHGDSRIAGAALALPAGATTVFLVLAKIEYFSYRLPSDDSPSMFVLDVVRILAEMLPIFPG